MKEGYPIPSFENAPEMKEHLPNTTERPPETPKSLQEQFVEALMEHFDDNPVDVLPKVARITPEELQDRYPEAAQIVACDFLVDGAEKGELITGAVKMGKIINIDHHANLPEMKRHVSSTNLALEYVKANGTVPGEIPVAINHIDTDSFLTACLVRGFISPQQIYGEAAIAGDHTGAVNEIADFLNPMDQVAKEGNEKFRYVLKNWLTHLLADPALQTSKQTQSLLKQVAKDREKANEFIESGKFHQTPSCIYWAEMDKRMESAYFAAGLPDANLIVLFSPSKDDPAKRIVKIRLGNGAPEGFDIKQLKIDEFDSNYGGRWNAGSNVRGGGTEMSPEEYIGLLDQRAAEVLEKLDQTSLN